MRNRFSFVSVSILALAVAACGSPAEESDDPAGDEAAIVEPATDSVSDTAGDEALADAEAGDAEAQDAADTGDAAEAAPTPTATPSATRSATPTPTATPRATPSAVASAAKPDSFTTCAICHSTESGQNGVGPTLAGIVGRRAGSVAGFSYSAALKGSNLTWNEANLQRYLLDPNAVVPGGSMPDPGIDAAQARAIINYLKTQ